MVVSVDERCWAAGFLESSAQIRRWKGGVRLRARRNDPEPLYRLEAILGLGVVEDASGKDARWTYLAVNDEIVGIVELLEPWLGDYWFARHRDLLDSLRTPRSAI